MSDYISRIFHNVFNNISTAAETPAGETVGSIVLLIVVGFLVCIIACAAGMAAAALLRLFNIDVGSMAACTVGTIILMVSSPEKSTFESVLGVGMVIVGAACTALTLMGVKAEGCGRSGKARSQGYAYYYGAFVLSMFAISPKWYGMLPGHINKWCLYIPLILSGLGALSELFSSLGGEES